MSVNPERRAHEALNKLRKLKGFCPLTPEEADAEYEEAPTEAMSDDEIASIVAVITSGELASWQPEPELDWAESMDLDAVEDEALQLFRNKGEGDEGSISAEDALRKELLDDGHDAEVEDGMDGDATPPSSCGK